jgi:hypothetical protein
LHFVAGGLAPITDLPGMTVHPDPVRHDTLPYQPPHTNGGSHDGGGRPGGPANGGINGGGNISTQAAAGIAKIKAAYGIDLTTYAHMSPTLANAIALATASYHFDFKWDEGSHTDWAGQVNGTISIAARYANDPNSFVQQMTHELEHVAHRVSDDPRNTPAETYVSHYLDTEGYCTLANERVRSEILSKGGGDIRIAGLAGNAPAYNAEYARWANGQEAYGQAAHNIGAYYGEHEFTTSGGQQMKYHEYYMNEYHRLGGTH